MANSVHLALEAINRPSRLAHSFDRSRDQPGPARAHRLPDVTVVADAGMISEANQKAIEAAGLSFILGMKIPDVPYRVAQWRREHPGQDIPDRHVFTQPWPAGPSSTRPDQVIYYRYKARPGPPDAARSRASTAS